MVWASTKRKDEDLVKKGKVAYVFPGQGSQAVGMGLRLYTQFSSARDVFDEVDQTLGFPLSRLCFEGPEDELTQTINVQPAVLTVSIACLKAAEGIIGGSLPHPDVVAGHSLGEYTALVVAGTLSLSETVRLVRERGRLMNEAATVSPGGMVAVLGLDEKTVGDICSSADTEISNINCPEQIVVSGAEEKLAEFKRLAEIKGARRIVRLKVSGAFHSRLMRPAAEGLKRAISEATFGEPLVPVMANVTADTLIDAEAIKEELADQIIRCVRWQASVENMIASGVTRFVEIGHGQVLADLIKRINPAVPVLNIGDVDIEKQVEKWWTEHRREHIKGLLEKAIQSEK
ncbi:MAG: [acyl-carrier-protein] S-malonyltransferase [Chloroflexi bacterium RBG_13_48_17]|nr:MAG: [acyl-carrier-protein] S-malonyltransferase [Chloroflexi bacterium RBG_13_48_17]